MAVTLSAGPRSASVLEDTGPSLLSRLRRLTLIPTQLPTGARLVRPLQAAAVFHAGILMVTLVAPDALPLALVLSTGMLVSLLALGLSIQQSAASSEDHASEPALGSPNRGLSPHAGGSGDKPTPLPFMGERIVPGPAALPVTGLARAAARLRHMSGARGQPWSELIARVSHELRTPLNAVIGFSDVLEAELLGPVGHPRYREYARHIRDCSRELLKSAEDTLAITCLLDHDPGARSGPVEAGADFRATVEEAWAFHTDAARGHPLDLDAHIPEGLEVLVDARPLRQILINLFAEARRRTDARGTVGLVATVDGDLVQVEVFLRGRPDKLTAGPGQASLPVCLARALLELQGATLIEVDDPYSTWRAVTVLARPSQSDFFAAPPSFGAMTLEARTPEPAHLC